VAKTDQLKDWNSLKLSSYDYNTLRRSNWGNSSRTSPSRELMVHSQMPTEIRLCVEIEYTSHFLKQSSVRSLLLYDIPTNFLYKSIIRHLRTKSTAFWISLVYKTTLKFWRYAAASLQMSIGSKCIIKIYPVYDTAYVNISILPFHSLQRSEMTFVMDNCPLSMSN